MSGADCQWAVLRRRAAAHLLEVARTHPDDGATRVVSVAADGQQVQLHRDLQAFELFLDLADRAAQDRARARAERARAGDDDTPSEWRP